MWATSDILCQIWKVEVKQELCPFSMRQVGAGAPEVVAPLSQSPSFAGSACWLQAIAESTAPPASATLVLRARSAPGWSASFSCELSASLKLEA